MNASFVEAELASQPEARRTAAAALPDVAADLQQQGERVAVIGCGTSWFVAMSYAAYRERSSEATQFWAESDPEMDYRHDPIAIAEPGRLVWSLGRSLSRSVILA